MPVQIGAKTHNFTDPTGLLSDCHRRVEMFLSTLQAVAQAIDSPATGETSRALESALRYFGQAAPKHTADEEESLFPRLRQIQHPEVQAAFSKVEQLEEEHRWAAPLHAEVDRLGAQYLSTGSLSSPEVDEFRKAVASLASMYKQHISVEDELVFPLAARMLSDADKSAIADEMAGRRKVRLVTELSEADWSTILTSQLPISRWHEQIGDPTIADGILDRLVHNAHRIEMRGESMRKKRNPPQDEKKE